MDINMEIDNYIKRKHYRNINSIIISKDNNIILEKYYNGLDKTHRNVMRSVAKSIMSITAGICLDKGIITSLNTPIYKYLPEFNEGRDPMHRAITIKHLLTMTSGIYWTGGVHYHCPQMQVLYRSKKWIEDIADTAVVNTPGTKYNYKELDVILLAAVLEKAIGSDYYDFLNEYLYKPLNITSERWWKSSSNIYYSCGKAGAGNGGLEEKPSNLTARDMLKIGELFLNGGIYNGKKIISKEYINEAVSPSKNNYGYGYLWWINKDYYSARGFGGQKIAVLPSKNTVIVIQATPTSRGMQYDDVFDFITALI